MCCTKAWRRPQWPLVSYVRVPTFHVLPIYRHCSGVVRNVYFDRPHKYAFIGTPKIFTTTGLGPRKNREMAGVDDLVVYMQTAVKYKTLYIPNPVVVYIFGVPNSDTKLTAQDATDAKNTGNSDISAARKNPANLIETRFCLPEHNLGACFHPPFCILLRRGPCRRRPLIEVEMAVSGHWYSCEYS